MGGLEDAVLKLVLQQIREGKAGDLTQHVYSEVQRAVDDALAQTGNMLRDLDPQYLSDPNPILFNQFPEVSTEEFGRDAPHNYQALWSRSPRSRDGQEILKRSHVLYVGFGGIQQSALLLARDGLGAFTLYDFDTFEPTNANRQALSFSSNIGKNKAAVGKDMIAQINEETVVEVGKERITPENIELVGTPDIIVDGSGDLSIRDAIHAYGREHRIPVLCWAWAGWEGQHITFMPDDPLYTEVFTYSPYSNSRGFSAAGLGILNGAVATDIQRVLLNEELAITYPRVATYNLKRNPVSIIRDVQKIREENGQ